MLTTHNQTHIIELSKWNGGGNIFKKVEEIRSGTGYNQTDFASSVGMSYRSYQERISHKQPDWRISELIGIADYNEGEIEIDLNGNIYHITIVKQ